MEITVIYSLLTLIQDAESRKDYDERTKLVYSLLYRASTVGWNCGIKIDPEEPDWPVIYIDLPTGQVSWHVKAYDGEWDGHDNEEKAKRIAQFTTHARLSTRSKEMDLRDKEISQNQFGLRCGGCNTLIYEDTEHYEFYPWFNENHKKPIRGCICADCVDRMSQQEMDRFNRNVWIPLMKVTRRDPLVKDK